MSYSFDIEKISVHFSTVPASAFVQIWLTAPHSPKPQDVAIFRPNDDVFSHHDGWVFNRDCPYIVDNHQAIAHLAAIFKKWGANDEITAAQHCAREVKLFAQKRYAGFQFLKYRKTPCVSQKEIKSLAVHFGLSDDEISEYIQEKSVHPMMLQLSNETSPPISLNTRQLTEIAIHIAEYLGLNFCQFWLFLNQKKIDAA